jgi:hypothetical protein
MMTEDNMSQTQKENPEDSFYFFLLDVKKVQENDAAFISGTAVSIWGHMKPEERWVYEQEARKKKQNLCEFDFKNKFRPRRRYRARIQRGLKQARTPELIANPSVPPGARQLRVLLQAWQWQVPRCEIVLAGFMHSLSPVIFLFATLL